METPTSTSNTICNAVGLRGDCLGGTSLEILQIYVYRLWEATYMYWKLQGRVKVIAWAHLNELLECCIDIFLIQALWEMLTSYEYLSL